MEHLHKAERTCQQREHSRAIVVKAALARPAAGKKIKKAACGRLKSRRARLGGIHAESQDAQGPLKLGDIMLKAGNTLTANGKCALRVLAGLGIGHLLSPEDNVHDGLVPAFTLAPRAF